MLQILHEAPDGLADCPADELEDLLGEPTLLHLPGDRSQPLHVSVLLHGNETAGWDAMRGILKDFAGGPLPRAMSVFIGNVHAARRHMRRLDGQLDYNRVWGGGASPEHAMARAALEEMRRLRPVASIDVHNTTGPNPHYACVNRLDRHSLHLASRFSGTVVYFRAPLGMHALAFRALCPAVTIECGMPESPAGAAHARAYLEQRLFEESMPENPIAAEGLNLFRTRARVAVPEGMSFSFEDQDADFFLPAELVEHNFCELPAGMQLGQWRDGVEPRLQVRSERGKDLFDCYFESAGGRLRVRRPFFLSMLTTRKKIVMQDCLCYIMERMDLARLA